MVILRDKAAWDAFCADGRASLAQWTPPEYPCAVAVSWMTPAFFTVDDARTLLKLSEPSELPRCGWPNCKEKIDPRWFATVDGKSVPACDGHGGYATTSADCDCER